jgi:CRISPR/Cas system-associated endonuclease Cas1
MLPPAPGRAGSDRWRSRCERTLRRAVSPSQTARECPRKRGGFTRLVRLAINRMPRDPVNSLLSLVYSMLVKDLASHVTGRLRSVIWASITSCGMGPALALDLMEPFRPLIAESAVLSAIITRMVTEQDFVRAGGAVALTPSGRKGFFRAYELRMDSLLVQPF